MEHRHFFRVERFLVVPWMWLMRCDCGEVCYLPVEQVWK